MYFYREISLMKFWSILIGLLLIIYFPLLRESPILRYDDTLLLSGVDSLPNIKSYETWINNGKILDIQPVRDFSYWLELKIQKHFNIKMYHFTNFVLWILCLLLASKIYAFFLPNLQHIQIATLYLALHPVSVNTTAWISGRKHLLSGFFILLCTYFSLNFFKRRTLPHFSSTSYFMLFGIVFFYILSVFSQPINCLWPLWWMTTLWLIYKLHKSIPVVLTTFILFAIAVVVIQINRYYYYSDKYIFGLVAPKHWAEGNNLSVQLTALGRYLFQLLLPFYPSITSYYPGSWMNMAGLFLIPPFLYICWKKISFKILSLCLLFIALPVAVVTGKMTSIFALDSYIFTPLFAWCGLLILLLSKLSENIKDQQKIRWLVFILIAINISITVPQVNAWKSYATLTMRAIELEKSPSNLSQYGQYLLSQGRYTEALEVGIQTYKWDMGQMKSVNLIGLALILNPILTWEQKYKILTDYPAPHFILYHYFRAIFLVQMDRWEEALQIYKQLVGTFNEVVFRALLIDPHQLFKDVRLVCSKVKDPVCPLMLQKIENLEKTIE